MKSPAWIKISAGGRSAGCISLCLSWVSDIATILTFFLLGYICKIIFLLLLSKSEGKSQDLFFIFKGSTK